MYNLAIAVVCGGISTEREVSLRSGTAVHRALCDAGFQNAYLFDLQKDNAAQLLSQKPDICFLALHGTGGEDGCIQGMLELAGIPYTGPGVAASAVCMDKILTKRVLQNAGLPTAEFVVLSARECEDIFKTCSLLKERIGLPMVLKSPKQGSSIGVVIVKSEDMLPAAVEEVLSYGDALLAEKFLKGTEVTLPILGNEELMVLPDVEITSEREFYDFTAKYTNGLCHHIIPARISQDQREEMCRIGKAAYRVLGCRGLSRIDFIIDEKQGPMIIEVNTIPGMTEMSLFPDAARAANMSFEALITTIVKLGMEETKK